MKKQIKKMLTFILLTTIVVTYFYSSLSFAENSDVSTENADVIEKVTIIDEDVEDLDDVTFSDEGEEIFIEEEIVEDKDVEGEIIDEIKIENINDEVEEENIDEESADLGIELNEADEIIEDSFIEIEENNNFDELEEINELFLYEMENKISDDELYYIINGHASPFRNIMFRSFMLQEDYSDSKVILNNFQLSSIYDGTPGFDKDDDPGNDSNSSNKIVRSYDKIVYRTAYSTISEDMFSSVNSGTFIFKAVLPVPEYIASWDLTAMNWLENVKINSDESSSTIEGIINIYNQNVSPRVGTINWVVSVNDAKNNFEIPSPTFYMGIDESFKETIGESIKVSAKTNMNAKLKFEGEKDSKPVFSLLLELVSNNEGKGMKGQEIPDTSKDINITLKANPNQTIGGYCNNYLSENNDFIARNIPYDDKDNELLTEFNKVYNGGDIHLNQNGNIMKVRVNNYSFDSLYNKVTHNSYKTNYYDGHDYNDDRYPFGAYLITLNNPGLSLETKIYSLEIDSLNAYSIDGTLINDFISSDNKDTYTRGIPQGGGPGMSGGPVNVITPTIINPTTKETFSLIKKDADRNLPPDYKVYPGELVRIKQTTMMYKSPNREYIEVYWGLLKFDTDMFEALKSNEEYSSPVSFDQPNLKEFYWVAKTDKSGWNSEEEMFNAHIKDIRNKNGYVLFDNSDEAIKSGYIVVGFLSKSVFENPNYVITFNGPATYPALKVKASALLNKETNKMYSNDSPRRVGLIISELEGIDFSGNSYIRENVYNSLGDDMDMYLHFKDIKLGMIKATYDKNGNIVSSSKSNAVGNRDGNYTHAASLVGASFYIQPYNTYVNKHISQKINEVDEKEVYNLDSNQRQVFFHIEAGTSAPVKLNSVDTITITEIIPKELNPINVSDKIEEKWGIIYDANIVQDKTTNGGAGILLSDFGKKANESNTWKDVLNETKTNSIPTYSLKESINSNKATILTWTFINYPVSYKLPTIHYSAMINKEVDYGQKILTETSIKSNFVPNVNKDSVGITPIRIGGATIEKNALHKFRDKNDPIGFEIKFSNNSILSDNSLMINSVCVDVLPYDDGLNNTGLNFEDYHLTNINLSGNLYDLNINDNKIPNLYFYYSLEDSNLINEKTKSLIGLNIDEKNIYDFKDTFWNKIKIELVENNNVYTVSKNNIDKILREITDKKITGIGIEGNNLSSNSEYTFSYEYDWNDSNKKDFHQAHDIIHNTVKMAVASDVFQETFDSAISYPNISKKIVKINDLANDNLNGETVRNDDLLTYKIFYSNNSNDTKIIKIFDEIPKGTTYVSNDSNNNCMYNESINSLECTFNDVKPNTLGSIEFTVKVGKNDKILEIINQAKVKIGDDDPILSEIIKNPKINIYATKDSNPTNKSTVKINDIITYSINLKNNSIIDVKNIVIVDEIPEGTVFCEVFNSGIYDNENNRVIFSVPILRQNEEIKVKFSVKVNKDNISSIINSAFYGDNNNPNLETNKVEHFIKKDNKDNIVQHNEVIYNVVNTSTKSKSISFTMLIMISILIVFYVENNKRKN